MPEGQGKPLEGIEDSVKRRRDGGKMVRSCLADLRTALRMLVASVVVQNKSVSEWEAVWNHRICSSILLSGETGKLRYRQTKLECGPAQCC